VVSAEDGVADGGDADGGVAAIGVAVNPVAGVRVDVDLAVVAVGPPTGSLSFRPLSCPQPATQNAVTRATVARHVESFMASPP
jgi:hypothetical protein